MNRRFYSTIQAAKILGVSRVAVFQKIQSGKIKAEKVGRNYIIAHKDLLETLGEELGAEKKRQIEAAVSRVMREYGGALRKLGKE